MKRFWYSFYADDQRSMDGEPARTFFCIGYAGTEEVIMRVLAEAESIGAVRAMVKDSRFYPEAEERNYEEVAADWRPVGGRFPNLHLWQVATPQQQGPKLT